MRLSYIPGLLALIGAAAWLWQERTASGLANPLTTGSNIAMTAPNNVPKAIPAAGDNCAVTIQVDFDPKDGGGSVTTPVCSGYDLPSLGKPLTKYNCAMPVCTDPSKCVATWVVRDAKPGVISVIAINAPTDAGVPIRVERGAGCTGP
jgi:hypothetical protein